MFAVNLRNVSIDITRSAITCGLYLGLVLSLSACGGGGSGGSTDDSSSSRSSAPASDTSPKPPAATGASSPPLIDPGPIDHLEGRSLVVNLRLAEGNAADVSFAIVSDADANLFSLQETAPTTDASAGPQLRFKQAPDFESPKDANSDNVYALRITATRANSVAEVDLKITVKDALEGRVVDAPLRDSEVFVDANNNGRYDLGEDTTRSDTQGYFWLPQISSSLAQTSPRIVARGGFDVATGNRLTNIVMFARLQSDQRGFHGITPITSLIALDGAQLQTSAAASVTTQTVLTKLGLSANLEYLQSVDPWAKTQAGDAAADAAQRINQQAGLLMQMAATVFAQQGDGQTAYAATEKIVEALFKVAAGNVRLSLSNELNVLALLKDSTASLKTKQSDDQLQALARVIARVNHVVANAAVDLDSDIAKALTSAAQTELTTKTVEMLKGDLAVKDFNQINFVKDALEPIKNKISQNDLDQDGVIDLIDLDDDNDGVPDTLDEFPLVKSESRDNDGDGTGDNADTDDDNDGVADDRDAFPKDKSEQYDFDKDGIGDNQDTDDDNDGWPDREDAFPFDRLEWRDQDADGIGDNTDPDRDGDGINNGNDAYPDISLNRRLDTDQDGRPNDCDLTCRTTGMRADEDDDGDGVNDALDAYPLDASKSKAAKVKDGQKAGDGDSPSDTDGNGSGETDGDSQQAELSGVAQTIQVRLLPTGTSRYTGKLTAAGPATSTPYEFSIASNGQYGTVLLTDPSTGVFTYEVATTVTAQQLDAFYFVVSDGTNTSSVTKVAVAINSDPLYRHQWHLKNSGQTNFASRGGTSGADLKVDSVIADGYTGKGIKVAIVDSDLQLAHPDLAANVVEGGSVDYVQNDSDPSFSQDAADGHHGTSVAGIVGAVGWNNRGVRGVAPDVALYGFNLIASTAQGGSIYSIAREIAALGGASYSSDIDIFNMSYGESPERFRMLSASLVDHFENGAPKLRGGKGAIYIKAMGNDFQSTEKNHWLLGATDVGTSLGASANRGLCTLAISADLSCVDGIVDPRMSQPIIIGVAALNADGIKTSYSTPSATTWIAGFGGESGKHHSHTGYGYNGYAAEEAVAADVDHTPGVMTTDGAGCTTGYVHHSYLSGIAYDSSNAFNKPSNINENPHCSYFAGFKGTSAAAPMISGVVALILQANPDLTWRDVKHILATTARQVDPNKKDILVDGIVYYQWLTNAANYKFHNWYGFGAIDAAAAVAEAKRFKAGSLGSGVFTDWRSSAEQTIPIKTQTLLRQSLSETASGLVEFVRLEIELDHQFPRDIGIRLQSPSGTVSTLLQPHTSIKANPSGNPFVLASNAFYGEPLAGDWFLLIYDHGASAGGELRQWRLQFLKR